MLPDSANGKLYFPKSLASFSKAINDIVNGWNVIKGDTSGVGNSAGLIDAAAKAISDDWAQLVQ